MELTDIIHISQEEALVFEADVFIAASGYETRSTCIPKLFIDPGMKKTVLAFSEYKKYIARPENDKFFTQNGFEMHTFSGKEEPDFNLIFNDITKPSVKILIDISVMTRTWYHTFLKYVHELRGFQEIFLRLVYCPAIYNEPSKARNKVELKKYSMLDSVRKEKSNSRKRALIMGLGNDKGLGENIFESIKPETIYLLYADPAIEKTYVENVFINNHSLINKVPIRNLKSYPLNDTKLIYQQLIDIVLPLRENYNISIIPQGPKIFSLLSMVFQISYPDVELLYPKYKVKNITDRKPYKKFTAIDLKFEAV